MHTVIRWIGILGFIAAPAIWAAQPAGAAAAQGEYQRIKVHSQALEGNLSGDDPTRDVSVYLPPAYASEPQRRFPVLYFLHGFTDNDAQWFGLQKHWINLHQILDDAMSPAGSAQFIVVMPNAYTRFRGSMYSSSATTGDWERFVGTELVAYIDSHYRTLAKAESRGLAGHSMGGYGTIRIGMKRPDTFSSLYMLSACCMDFFGAHQPQLLGTLPVNTVTPADLPKLSFTQMATMATAAAWSPDPAKPPFYLDVPLANGQIRPEIQALYAANSPLILARQHIDDLRTLKAIAFDAGDQDTSIAAASRELDQLLDSYDIAHRFDIYQGDHLNHIAERIRTQVLPFFAEHLAFD